MTFGVGDGFFKGQGCNGFITCHGAVGESCAVFPCPPYDGVYAGWWTSGCGETPPATFYLHYWTGTRWELLDSVTPEIYEGYVWVRWPFSEGNCGWAYKISFLNDVAYFLVGNVPASLIPCEMWTSDMIKAEKERLKELIKVEKDDAAADVKVVREEAKTEVAMIRGKAKIDIAAERAEYKEISTAIRARVKRELVDIRAAHNELEASLKTDSAAAKVEARNEYNDLVAKYTAAYRAAKAASDAEESDENSEVRSTGTFDIDEEKRKETDDIGNIQKQKDIDVATEYRDRDADVVARNVARDLKIEEIKDSGKPCVIL